MLIIRYIFEECNRSCNKTLFEAEIKDSVHKLILAVIKELQFQLAQVHKDQL